MGFAFEVVASCADTQARLGRLTMNHGMVSTPVFMPLATQGTVKTLVPEELGAMDVHLILSNAYHLYLRPGIDVIEKLGGLHRFMSWDGSILTDSGGFQVYSLGHLRRVTEEGVLFRSHLDGSEHFLSPEKAVEIQAGLGSDIAMTFDECPPYTVDRDIAVAAMERTHRWAVRCRQTALAQGQAIFGIAQGGTFPELRRLSASVIAAQGFDGYALGGLSLGEPKALTSELVEETVAVLPPNKPRYLMGVGSPEDLLEGVARGIDMFDCALPTRIARNGSLFSRDGRKNIRNARFRLADEPIDEWCDCYTCRNFSAAYLHHLFKCEELLAYRMATLHNVRFVVHLMEEIRASILDGSFARLESEFVGRYRTTDEDVRVVQKQRWIEAQRSKQSANPNNHGVQESAERA